MERDGKSTKLPYNPKTGALADSTAPLTWGTVQNALIACKAHKGNGIGFVFSKDDPFTGIDFDKCVNPETGGLEPCTKRYVQMFKSYTEFSPSGKGLHIIVQGQLPPGRNRKGQIEVYSQARYFTFTGNVLNGCVTIAERQAELDAFHREVFAQPESNAAAKPPPMPEELLGLDAEELLNRARNADNGAKFTQLRTGDWKGAGYPSQSEADQAFCNMLAFWFGCDQERMDRAFRRSGLYREKWNRKNYLECDSGPGNHYVPRVL